MRAAYLYMEKERVVIKQSIKNNTVRDTINLVFFTE